MPLFAGRPVAINQVYAPVLANIVSFTNQTDNRIGRITLHDVKTAKNILHPKPRKLHPFPPLPISNTKCPFK